MGAETYRDSSAAWGDHPSNREAMRATSNGAGGVNTGAMETGSMETGGMRAADEMRSIGRLFNELSTDMSTLLRQEVQLAQAETMEKVRGYGQAGGMMGAGGAVAYAGVILLLVALAFLLAQWMEFWIAAGIVGLLTVAVGAVLLISGRNRLKKIDPAPEQTLSTAKELVNDLKEQVR